MIKHIQYILILSLCLVNNALALIEIDITEGNREPLPIAISDFFYDEIDSSKLSEISVNLSNVVKADLERCGLFEPINKDAFIQNNSAMHLMPRFADWRLIKSQALVTGKLKIVDGDKLRVEFRLWDTLAEKEIEALVLITTLDNWRRISHMISDKVYERLTGERGYFDTRILYVSESGPKNQRIKKLAIMDLSLIHI